VKLFFDTNVYVAEALLGEAAEQMLSATEHSVCKPQVNEAESGYGILQNVRCTAIRKALAATRCSKRPRPGRLHSRHRLWGTQRAYHNATHIADCLLQLDAAGNIARNPSEVEMALWFHDAVYDSRAADNEEKSAAWAARELIAGGVGAASAALVTELVLATRHDAVAETEDAQVVADIDLSILGREPAVFDAYDQAIRTEYQWVPEWEYREARARILSGFLNRRFLYQTEYFRERYERQARKNLERTIVRISGTK